MKQQSAKFGDDVKYLAEFTAGIKKFDPWIQKADAKRAVGMLKPKNLEEANDQLASAQVNSKIEFLRFSANFEVIKKKVLP